MLHLLEPGRWLPILLLAALAGLFIIVAKAIRRSQSEYMSTAKAQYNLYLGEVRKDDEQSRELYRQIIEELKAIRGLLEGRKS